MTMEVDGKSILEVLIKDPSKFGMSPTGINELAATIIITKLKDKTLSLSTLRSIAGALSDQDLRLLIGSLPAKDAKNLAKLDDKNPDYKSADEHWHRTRIIMLAKKEVEPALPTPQTERSARKPAAPRAPKTPKDPKIGKIMGSEVQKVAAKRGKKRDGDVCQ